MCLTECFKLDYSTVNTSFEDPKVSKMSFKEIGRISDWDCSSQQCHAQVYCTHLKYYFPAAELLYCLQK